MAKKHYRKHDLTDMFEGTTYYDFFAMERDGEKVQKVITEFDNSKKINRNGSNTQTKR